MLLAPLIETLSVALVGSGLTLMLGLWYLRHQAQKVRDEALALSHANTWNNFDALRLPSAAWPILQERFVSMTVEYRWFGMHHSEQFGPELELEKTSYPLLHRSLSVGDITIEISIWQKKLRGEQSYFASTLWEIFILLLQMDLWIKSATISSALEQSSKAITFVRHDAKNYIQLVSLLMGDISRLQPNIGEQVSQAIAPIIKRMQDVLPMMETRSKALLAGLGREESPSKHKGTAGLSETIMALTDAYNLKTQIHGQASVLVHRPVLESILENLIKNFADHGDNRKPLQVQIEAAEKVIVRMWQQGGATPEAATLLHLFEPFWTTSASGLGLGLYQARLQAREQEGDLNVEAIPDHGLCFVLNLPSSGVVTNSVE